MSACSVKDEMLVRCGEATTALAEIGAHIVGSPDGAFDGLWEDKKYERARQKCIDIRHEIATHVRAHGCGLFG
jgi:hypothetical protein